MGHLDDTLRDPSNEAEYLGIVPDKNGDSAIRTVLASCPLLEGLSLDEHARVLADARGKVLARGDVLYLDGDPVEEVLLLLSGMLKVTKLGPSGTVAILGLGVPGDALGAADLFFTGKYMASAEAVRPCRVLTWRASAFKSLVMNRPVLLLRILRAQAAWLRELEERFHEMATDLVGARVARQLLRLHQKMVRHGSDQVEIHLSHEELAQMTGTNLYTISRLFSEWEEHGAVRSRRQAVSARDVELLREMCEGR